MALSAKPTARILAVLKFPQGKTPDVIQKARRILAAMTDNPNFPSPDPPLAEIEACIEALSEAEVRAGWGTLGNVSVRDGKRIQLDMRLQRLRSYVQATADQDLERAASIIESAGMYVKKRRGREPRVFGAKPGRVSGEVDLIAPQAADRASYEFATSTDGKETWVVLPMTVRANIVVKGLLPGSTVYFRYRFATKDGLGDWSEPISIIVE